MKNMELRHDADNDVLYVREAGVQIWSSEPIQGDDFVILNMDRDGRVVGLQLMCAREMAHARWREFFHPPEIPEEIYATVDRWLRDHASAPGANSNSEIRTRAPITDHPGR